MKRMDIALVNKFDKLTPARNFGNIVEISVSIGVKQDDKKTPQNWQHIWDEPKTSHGGCFARIFASEYGENIRSANLFNNFGPEINYGDDLSEYRNGLRKLERIRGRLNVMEAKRGHCADAAEEMGRWLEATGITDVWIRPDKQDHGWHHEGEWEVVSIGNFVNRVRANLFPGTVKATEVAI